MRVRRVEIPEILAAAMYNDLNPQCWPSDATLAANSYVLLMKSKFSNLQYADELRN